MRDPGDRGGDVPAERIPVHRAARAAREDQLTVRQVRVETRAGQRRAVAELRAARPEVHAGVRGLVGVALLRRPRRPAPGPDARETHVARDLLRGEHLELRHLEPRPRGLQAFTAARSLRRVEPEHQRQPRGRDPDRDEVLGGAAEHLPQRPTALDGSELVDARRREVRLAHDCRDLGDAAPPVGRLAARVGRARDEQRRAGAARGQRAQEDQHVLAVLRVRRAPGRQRLRALQLVLAHDRRRAAHRRGRVRVEPVRAVGHGGRVGGLGRRPRATREVEVEVDRLRAPGPDLRREEEVRGSDDIAGLCELLPVRRRAVRVVDPDRFLRRQRAGVALRRDGRPRRRGQPGAREQQHE